ncbi:hypothetical protein FSP39_016386 [Pinctada imbricata]|uniref:Uncharacterized protein n=1 Tax=Pinctada imbricata TaxID=66713 RepID=A0AA88XJ34_PINIB|nr:hypothetical protein FSP39_016386 [Pinctada imbricata]
MTTLAVLSLLMTLTPVLVLCKITELDVSTYCISEDTYEVSRSESYNLTWKGDFPKGKWFPCKFTFKPKEDGDDICVTSEVFEMPAYITKLKYYKDGESTADKTFTTVKTPGTDDYCVWVDKLHIVFDCSGGIIRSDLDGSYVSLKVWSRKGNHVNVGLIIGLSILAVFIICAVTTVVIICKCYRRQGARGFIHHTLSEVNAPGNHQYPSAMVSPYRAGMQQTAGYPITASQTDTRNMPTMGVSAPYLAQDMYPVSGPTVGNADRPWPPQNQQI